MRNISFALTTEQVRRRQKTVTRRIGWTFLKPGDLLQPVVKCQGLKKDERVEKIGGPIRVVSVRREPLGILLNADDYAWAEVDREGFPASGIHPARWPSAFVDMFCATHKVPAGYADGRGIVPLRRCEPSDEVTRIEFEYVDADERKGAA